MIKKILLTALVILLMYALIRWKQRRKQEITHAPAQTGKKNPAIVIAAVVIFALMAGSIGWWLSAHTLN